MLLSQDVKATRVVNSTAAGQTDVTSDAVDSRDFDTVAFYGLIGTVSAGGTGIMKLQHSDESASGFADAGVSVSYTDADADDVLILEVSQPIKRYCRVVITRSTANSAINGVLALSANASALPVEHDSTVAASALALAPTA